MDDVGSILAEAAAEVQMRSPRGEGRAQSASGALAAEVFGEMAESKGSDERHRRDERLGGQPLSGMDMLKRAANTVAEEEQHDSAQAFKAAGLTVRKSMDDEYDQTFEDEKIDVEEVLGRISEDIHNNKIEYSGADIDKALMEAAEDLERDQPRDPPSSPDASDDDEPGDEARNRELIIAVAQGDEKNVRWLLSHGASYCCSDMHGWTPLHWAASKGNEDMIALLLDAAGNERLKKFVNRPDALSGWTPLHIAVVGGHLSCIKLLIASKGKNYKKNKFGESPSDGIPFGKASPEYGACMRALGHEFKAVGSRLSARSRLGGSSQYNRNSKK